MDKRLLGKAGILFLTVIALTACAGKTMVESDLRIKGAPDWVNEGTSILKNRDGRFFHGIGSATPMGDDSLQLSTADNRARAEIARILTSYMEVAFDDYTSAATTGEGTLTESEISRQIQNVSKVNLTGAHIIAHWRDKRTNVVYALAELDMKYVKDTLGKVQDMNASARQHFMEHGDNIFDRIAKEKQ